MTMINQVKIRLFIDQVFRSNLKIYWAYNYYSTERRIKEARLPFNVKNVFGQQIICSCDYVISNSLLITQLHSR
jgi:hypothetical protein